jgi:rubrerythrin
MDIIEYAMKMELDGMTFYKKHADVTSDPELKQIFTTLVEEEVRHYQIFKKLKDNPADFSEIDLTTPTNREAIQNIFEQMSQNNEKKSFGEDVISVWTEALRIEEKAHAFYKEKAETEADPSTKKLMLAIAEEETRHVHMIDAVLMYLKHPETFAQSTQFKDYMSLEGR